VVEGIVRQELSVGNHHVSSCLLCAECWVHMHAETIKSIKKATKFLCLMALEFIQFLEELLTYVSFSSITDLFTKLSCPICKARTLDCMILKSLLSLAFSVPKTTLFIPSFFKHCSSTARETSPECGRQLCFSKNEDWFFFYRDLNGNKHPDKVGWLPTPNSSKFNFLQLTLLHGDEHNSYHSSE
jgi:hypothetical protein